MTTELRDGLARALYEAFAARMGKPDQKWDSATTEAKGSFGSDADVCLAFIQQHNDTAERLAIAERALVNHGYRKSCDIPACNCGNQWNHGGHAVARLSEIDNATGDHWRNGELLRDRVNRIVTAVEQHNDFARRVREVAVYGARPGGFFPRSSLDEIVKLCDEELGNG